MLTITRVLLTVLGLSAIAIGLMIFVMGPHATAGVFDAMLRGLLDVNVYAGGLEHVNTDSEMRFFSVFWLAYGVILLWLSSNLILQARWVFCAIGLFFLGGVGRVLSYMAHGAPDPLFVALAVIELLGPVIVAGLFALGLRRQP